MAENETSVLDQKFNHLFEAIHAYTKIAAFPTARAFVAPKQDLEAIITKLSSELKQQLNA